MTMTKRALREFSLASLLLALAIGSASAAGPPDSDSDGMSDAFELSNSFDPLDPDENTDELDAVQCEGYVIPVGEITSAHLEIIMPFDNELVIKEITGAALMSTLERSVSSIPSEKKGWFLHPSSELRYAADCALTAQVVNADGTVIETEGSRVTTVTIGGEAIDVDATYKVATTAFIAAGSDGHVELGAATPTTSTEVGERQAIIDYVMANTPVNPAIDGRIELTSACAVE